MYKYLYLYYILEKKQPLTINDLATVPTFIGTNSTTGIGRGLMFPVENWALVVFNSAVLNIFYLPKCVTLTIVHAMRTPTSDVGLLCLVLGHVL
jgi:hypothetical protein